MRLSSESWELRSGSSDASSEHLTLDSLSWVRCPSATKNSTISAQYQSHCWKGVNGFCVICQPNALLCSMLDICRVARGLCWP